MVTILLLTIVISEIIRYMKYYIITCIIIYLCQIGLYSFINFKCFIHEHESR